MAQSIPLARPSRLGISGASALNRCSGGGGVLGLNALPPSLACKSKAELEVGLGFCALDLAPLYLLIPKNA